MNGKDTSTTILTAILVVALALLTLVGLVWGVVKLWNAAAVTMEKRENYAAAAKLIGEAGRILVSGHLSPDGDSLGSMIALVRLLRGAGKDAHATADVNALGKLGFLEGAADLIPVRKLKRERKFDLFIALDNCSFDRMPPEVRPVAVYMLHSYNSKLTCGYGDHRANNLTLQLGQKYWVETELNAGKQTQKIVVNGVTNTVLNATDSQSIDTGYSLYLFAINKDGQPDWYSKARCYGFKIWQNEVLVRDFRPCLKNGVPGLYDDVSKRIFYSLGTPFVYNNVCRQSVKPNEVVYVEYIESDGNNTLDTGVPARSGRAPFLGCLRADGSMRFLSTQTRQ